MVDVVGATNATVAQAAQIVQNLTPAPGWVQSIGGMISGLFAMLVPQQYLWLVSIGLAILAGWYVVRQLRQGVLTFTALWVIISIITFMALKYIGL